ncbi:unnamed protein product, partial [Didymodactylos carnosus]
LFCNAQAKVSQLQELNPNADVTELISAICSDSAWLQELTLTRTPGVYLDPDEFQITVICTSY